MNATQVPKVGAAALVALVCALALAGPAAAGAAPAPPGGAITPGRGVGPITIGTSREDLVFLWGRPEGTGRDLDGVDLYDYLETRGVRVFLTGDQVVQLLVVTPAWSTPDGIRVGTTRPEVRAFLGPPDDLLPGQIQDEALYWYKQRGLIVIFKDRAAAAIVVLAARSAPVSQDLLKDLPETGRGREQGGR
jgi:hypothetical protein